MAENQPRPIDRRTADRYIKRGELTEKDLEKHLKSLPDLAEEAAPVEAHLERRPLPTHS